MMMFEKEPVHPKTFWKFIKNDIELKIINGTLKTADKVPSIAELASIYDVSKNTAKKALEDMFNEGTVTKKQGIGYFVTPYTKGRLRAKHIQIVTSMLNECITYAELIGVSKEELEEVKQVFVSCVNAFSSR